MSNEFKCYVATFSHSVLQKDTLPTGLLKMYGINVAIYTYDQMPLPEKDIPEYLLKETRQMFYP